MPDGRKQIVTYKVADAYSGYVADVRYEGEGMYKFLTKIDVFIFGNTSDIIQNIVVLL